MRRCWRYLAYAVIAIVVLVAGAVAVVPRLTGQDSGGRNAGAGHDGDSQEGRESTVDPFGVAGEYLRTRRGSVTAVAEDLRTGQSWTLGNGRAQAEASTVKVDILQALLAQSRGTGTRAPRTGAPGGLPAAWRALAAKMITLSDNDAATALWNADGGASGIGRYNQAAGLTGTRLSACVRCPGFPYPGWGLSATTPADQVTLLRQLVAPGSLLSSAERGYELSLLEHVTPSQRWGVSSGVPAGVTVALKNGWLPLKAGDWQVNTAGWVSGQGRDYLLAVLSTRDPSEAYGIATVSRVGALVWSALG